MLVAVACATMNGGLSQLIDPRLALLAEQSRDFYARRTAARGPSSNDELLAVRAAVPAAAPSQPPAVEEVVAVGARSVPLRIHSPAMTPAAGVLLEIHGGGFYLGSAATSDVRNRQLADALGIAVVSVDYRLAPENAWPAAPDDCEPGGRRGGRHPARGQSRHGRTAPGGRRRRRSPDLS